MAFGAGLALRGDVMALTVGGTILGIVWGALPGLSTTMAMALLSGLTYSLSETLAIAFLLAAFVGSVYGGVISSIFVNVPGTPDNVPTMLEGFPLHRRGEGATALAVATVGSLAGGYVGIVLFAALAPWFLNVALRFGSWELALIGIWGVLLSGTLTSGESVARGWVSGLAGLALGLVGRDALYGFPRLTFGRPELVDGLDYVAVLLGLFGLAEVFDTFSAGQAEAAQVPVQGAGRLRVTEVLRRSVATVGRYWKDTVRGIVVGMVTGIAPGMGANAATYLSYNLAKQSAEDAERQQFGKGSYKGLLAADVADDANLAGALLPTLTLGVPGSAPAAILMASMMVHNVTVGPLVAIRHPGLLDFVYAVLAVAFALVGVLGFLLVKPVLWLFSFPRTFLMGLVGLLCLLGSYLARSLLFDVYVTLAAGVVGWLMRRWGYPPAPMVLGLILGPLVDTNLRRSFMAASGWQELLARPVGLVLLGLVAFTLYDGLFRRRWMVADIGAAESEGISG